VDEAPFKREQARQEQFRQVVENINEVFWIFDAVKLRTIYVSPAFDRIWGIRRQRGTDRASEVPF